MCTQIDKIGNICVLVVCFGKRRCFGYIKTTFLMNHFSSLKKYQLHQIVFIYLGYGYYVFHFNWSVFATFSQIGQLNEQSYRNFETQAPALSNATCQAQKRYIIMGRVLAGQSPTEAGNNGSFSKILLTKCLKWVTPPMELCKQKLKNQVLKYSTETPTLNLSTVCFAPLIQYISLTSGGQEGKFCQIM